MYGRPEVRAVIEQLEQLCYAVGSVGESDARQVVEAVNRRLKVLLNAHIVKLYWKEEAREGVILKPIAFINDTDWPDPESFQFGADSRGVLEWVYRAGEPLWLEDVRTTYQQPSVVNEVSGAEIDTDLLQFSNPPQSDAMVVVPIRERGVVCGVYSIELDSTTERLSDRVVYLMQRLARSLGTLQYNADTYQWDLKKTSKAIRAFLDSIQTFTFDSVLLDQNWRTAFVARPYRKEFGAVQTAIEDVLAGCGVRGKHYVPETRQYVVSEIINQIKNAHFCIADLTGNNANVLAEVGMMMVVNKSVLVLKEHHDEAEIPFDLSQFSIWEYELSRDDSLLVWSAADQRLIPLREIVERFLKTLAPETGFAAAKRWVAPGQEPPEPVAVPA
jgi:hypothetical protein